MNNETPPKPATPAEYDNIMFHPSRAGIAFLASKTITTRGDVIKAHIAARRYRDMVGAVDELASQDALPPCFDCHARTIYYCQESDAMCREFRFYIENGHNAVPDNRVYSHKAKEEANS